MNSQDNVHTPVQPSFRQFIPRFFGALFGPQDRIVVCRLHTDGRWTNESLTYTAAVDRLLGNEHSPNLYFRASSHDGSPCYGQANCLAARALFVDIDYGKAGHKQQSTFDTVDDALSNLLTAPARPSAAWLTGHGIQAAYLLRQPFSFAQGEPSRNRYAALGKRLATMLGADSTFTAEHAFRVPLTINAKPDVPPVRGTLLWFAPSLLYDFAHVESLCAAYDIEDLLIDNRSVVATSDDAGHIAVPYEALPADLREEIEGGGERSERLFGIVGRMVRDGYSDSCIRLAASHGQDFVDKYGRRQGGLPGEVERCLAKVRSQRRVYSARQAPPISVHNAPDSIALADCPPLPPEFNTMLDRYERVAGIKLAVRVRDAARFHEHVFAQNASGVLESPCGAGKSVWALCHAAMRATTNRYLYVVETIDALYNAADMLEKLTDTPVGRVHGFNAAACQALCGKVQSWKECNPSNPRSVCHACQQATQCAFFTRQAQLARPLLCLTHNGFVRMLEEDAAALRDATVLVDEDLSPFNSLRVSVADLERLARYVDRPDLAAFFPHTAFAHDNDLAMSNVKPEAKTFARRNYVHADRQDTAAVGTLCVELRRKLWSVLRDASADAERAADTLVQLLSFFRPTTHGDATYAYREGVDDRGAYVVAKRSRFSLGVERPYRALWMLNASAQLAPYPYPDNLPVFACPDLPGNSHLVTLHVVRANPTKTQQEKAIRLSAVPLHLQACRRHERVLLALDKDSPEAENVRHLLRQVWDGQHLPELQGKGPQLVELQRGRIKGVNNAGDCTLALLTAMSTFTGIDDCALHAALQYGRTFPDTPHVFTASGSPNWPGGRMLVPAMRTYYALRSLDEIYQAIWRTAVRNDQPIEAVIALPDEHWLAALYRTVMPGMLLASAYVEKDGEDTAADGENAVTWNFVFDEKMYGLGGLLAQPAGDEVKKTDVAARLGYTGSRAWEKSKGAIMSLLDDDFEDGSTNRVLRRKART